MNDLNAHDRLVRLESAIAHLQHDLEQMNQALLSMHGELKEHTERMDRIERRLQILSQPAEHRDPIDERPPHY